MHLDPPLRMLSYIDTLPHQRYPELRSVGAVQTFQSTECVTVPIENWSDNILMVDLQDDPSLTDDLTALIEKIDEKKGVDVVLNFTGVDFLNSSNIAKLLKLRKIINNHQRKLVLCGINTNVWGLFMVTGLDKVFEFTESVATGLASVQIETAD